MRIFIILLLFANLSLSAQVLVKDINPGPSHSKPQNFFRFHDKVYFCANFKNKSGESGNGCELWETDATEAGTKLVYRREYSSASEREFASFQSDGVYLYFSNGVDIFQSDGSTNGCHPFCKGIEYLALTGNVLVRHVDVATGEEPWLYNASDMSGHLLKDIRIGSLGSSPSEFFVFGNKVFFRVIDGVQTHLWTTDLTESGTMPFGDCTAQGFTVHNNRMYMFGNDGHDAGGSFETDGTVQGTHNITQDIIAAFLDNKAIVQLGETGNVMGIFDLTLRTMDTIEFPIDSRIYITYSESFRGTVLNHVFYFYVHAALSHDLWRTDGTKTGTYKVNTTHDQFFPIQFLTTVGSNVYFSVQSENGIYRCDGTDAGIYSYDHCPNGPGAMFNYNGILLFSAYKTEGYELWKLETGQTTVNDVVATDGDQQLTIYPHPVDDVVSLRCSEPIRHIELFTVQGRLLRHSNLPTLSLSDLTSGLYVLKVFQPSGVTVLPCVKR